MEKLNHVDQNTPKSTSQPKPQRLMKKPIKVVYFSNPMKVRTTPEGFRAVVQELTGRDSNVADDLSGFAPSFIQTDEDPGPASISTTAATNDDFRVIPPDPAADESAAWPVGMFGNDTVDSTETLYYDYEAIEDAFGDIYSDYSYAMPKLD